TYNRRVTVYSIGANTIPYSGVRNAASLTIHSIGAVSLGGSVTATDVVGITIGNTATNTGTGCSGSGLTSSSTTSTSSTSTTTGPSNAPVGCGATYTYTVKTNDTQPGVVDGLVAAINASNGDANAFAFADLTNNSVVLTAKTEGIDGNNVTYVTSVSTKATETLTAAGATLTGGGDASRLGPGTLVSVQGSNLSAAIGGVAADPTQPSLPTTLGGTEFYINGIRVPLLYVSPSQINAQIPWELNDTTSVNAYVRSVMNDGTVMVTTPIAITIVPQNPGIFPLPG